MSDLDLAAIRARSDRVGALDGLYDALWCDAANASCEDVPDLLAEVERRDERVSDLQAEYAKAAASWDRQRERLTGEIERLRVVA